jgi:hypothetical protein
MPIAQHGSSLAATDCSFSALETRTRRAVLLTCNRVLLLLLTPGTLYKSSCSLQKLPCSSVAIFFTPPAADPNDKVPNMTTSATLLSLVSNDVLLSKCPRPRLKQPQSHLDLGARAILVPQRAFPMPISIGRPAAALALLHCKLASGDDAASPDSRHLSNAA